MNVPEVLEGVKDALSVKRVFGEPYERNGVTLIPAASFGGGGGGGGDNAPQGGGGAGFGLTARPAGVYVIRDGRVEWQPALDVNRIVTVSGAVLVAALFAWRGVAKTRARKRG